MADAAALRVAVVGTGWWGEQHTRAWSANATSTVCAVMGRNPERTAARAAACGATPYVDLHEMIEREQPDLVSMCLPNTEHFAPTMAVIEAGVPLFVEKPLVFDLGEADALLGAAQAKNLFFAINFNHRFARPIRMAAKAVAEGKLGTLTMASWRFGGEGSSAHHRFANLIETQCHGFDQLEQLCGPITSVAAQMTDVANPGAGWQTLVLALAFESGAVGSMIGTYDSSYAYPGAHRLELDGTAGRVEVLDTIGSYSFQARGNEMRELWSPGYFNEPDRQFSDTMDRHVRAVARALLASDPPPVSATAGRRALQLALAAVESFETGRRVEVDRPTG
jgi:predicted dehydrogenase